MEAMEELLQLSEFMRHAASLLADDDPSDDASPRCLSTFLNVVALGNVVSIGRRRQNPPHDPLAMAIPPPPRGLGSWPAVGKGGPRGRCVRAWRRWRRWWLRLTGRSLPPHRWWRSSSLAIRF